MLQHRFQVKNAIVKFLAAPSAISVPSNIAEGAARNTAKEFNNFLCVTQGSTASLKHKS
jgi:four helix bundle protein